MRRPLAIIVLIAGISIPAINANAQSLGSISITAPVSTSLGSAATGSPAVAAQLGSVKVTDTRALGLNWTSTVSSTSFTGPGPTVIANSSVTYTSGTATATTGVVTPVPGALVGVTLGSPKTAFSGTLTAVTGNTVTWNPTISVALPSNALTGGYSGTITHSVS